MSTTRAECDFAKKTLVRHVRELQQSGISLEIITGALMRVGCVCAAKCSDFNEFPEAMTNALFRRVMDDVNQTFSIYED